MQEETDTEVVVPKKRKHFGLVKNRSISELAKAIMAENLGKTVTDTTERVKKFFPDVKTPDKIEAPKPIVLREGVDSTTAFVVRSERDIDAILTMIFKYETVAESGQKYWTVDGGYFIHNQTIVHKLGKPFKVISVEDMNGFRYQLWFQVEDVGYLSNLIINRSY